MKKQLGFTFIEMVIVIVIIGFLAATAIPKFLDLTDQAKQANIEAMAGGFATGVSLVRAQWEAEGRIKINGVNKVDYDGTVLVLTTPPDPNPLNIRPGYPTGLEESNAGLSDLNTTRCIEIWNGIYSQPPRISANIADLNDSSQNVDYLVNTTTSGSYTLCAYYLKETLSKDNSNSFIDPAGDTNVGNNFSYNPANSSVRVNINNN